MTQLAEALRQAPEPDSDVANPRRLSYLGLNCANFFLAEVGGVIMPFLNDFLHDKGWRYDTIGAATAIGGLGVLAAQTPAGIVVDRSHHPRRLLIAASLALGFAYGVLPYVPLSLASVFGLLFFSGVMQALFLPLLSALAIALAGRVGINRVIGMNQVFFHTGNIALAGLTIVLMRWESIGAIFMVTLITSVCAAACVPLISAKDLRRPKLISVGLKGRSSTKLPRDRRIPILLGCITLFNLANAPSTALVALYINHLGGSKAQIANVVLIGQLVMVGAAWLAGRLGDAWGRKPLMIACFIALPVRILLYAAVHEARWLPLIQTLDGIGGGIYGVVVVSICADICGKRPCFNTLVGLTATTLAFGGVLGPLLAGLFVEYLGFGMAFAALAAVAAVGALLYLWKMPETLGRPFVEQEQSILVH